MDSLVQDTRILWSTDKDETPVGAGRNVVQGVHQCPLEIRIKFFAVLGRVCKRLNRDEKISVYWWHAPFLYIEVRDTRWRHYPCDLRMLVSFDTTNGKCASSESANQYAFARKGWRSLAKELVGCDVRQYTDCGHPENAQCC